MSQTDSPAESLPSARLPASTLEYLQWHALMQPHKAAIVAEQAAVSYERLYLDALRVSHAVAQCGVKPGQLVAVCTPDPYLHWLLLLACESLSAVSASFLRQEWQATQELLTHADWVLTDEAIQGTDAFQQVLSADWIHHALNLPAAQALQFRNEGTDLDAPVRLTRSSGSTGQPKLIQQNRYRFEHSIRTVAQEIGLTRDSVFLVTAPFVVNVMYLFSSACLRLGATVAWAAPSSDLVRDLVTHTWLLPRVLNDWLNSLPSARSRDKRLTVAVGGGPLPAVLRERTRALLTDDILVGYATNEVGSLARLVDGDQLVLLPGVDMLIVGDHGEPVATSQVGHIAVRTPGMIASYWRQPEQTSRHFRRGWFFPGDMGRWVGARRFVLLGRQDDLLNLGGIKQSALPVEDEFLRQPEVRDVAVMAMADPQGVDVLLAVLVVVEGTDVTELGQRVGARLPAWADGMRVMTCRQIPRNVAGKVDRPRLLALLQSGAGL